MTDFLVTRARPVIAGVIVGLACVMAQRPAAGVEPVQEFVSALRRQKMHDLVEEYLLRVKDNPNVSAEVKQTIPYEIGKTLSGQAAELGDLGARFKLLDRAKTQFDEFLTNNPQHELRGEAQKEIAQLLYQRARFTVELALSPKTPADKKDQGLVEARAMFAEAQKAYEAIVEIRKAEYEEAKASGDRNEQRKRFDILLPARLDAAIVAKESYVAWPEGSPERKKIFEDSVKRFDTIFTTYKKRLIGLMGGMHKAQCLQSLGDVKNAITTYQVLLMTPAEEGPFREFHNTVLAQALEIYATHETEGNLEEAINRGDEWLKAARASDERGPGIAVLYFYCVALDKKVEALKASGDTNEAKKRKAALLEILSDLTRSKHDFQQRAKTLLGKHRDVDEETGEPDSFDAAYARAISAKDQAEAVSASITKAKETQKPEELAKLPALEKELAKARGDALKYFHLAVMIPGEDTLPEKIHQGYYLLSHYYHTLGRYSESAVLGEHVARRYSKSSGAKRAALTAVYSYYNLFADSMKRGAPPADREFELQRAESLTKFAHKNWPKEPETDNCWMILAGMTRIADPLKAAGYYDSIAEESPNRAESEMSAGSCLWSWHSTLSRRTEADRPSKEETAKLVAEAQSRLDAGIKRARAAGLSPSSVKYSLSAAELNLAQLYMSQGQPDKAIELLELAETGPLAMVRGKYPEVTKAEFPESVLKTSLRAYVAAQQMEKAQQAMNELEALVADKPDAATSLIKIYVSLGRELEEQVSELKQAGKQEELQKVLVGFEAFLAKISAGEATFATLNWVAESYMSLAEGLKQGNQIPPEAKKYFDQARATYEIMVKKVDEKSKEAAAVQLRIARCQRAAGEFAKSIETLAKVLEASPNAIEAQKEAAFTFMAQGETEPSAYLKAIQGDQPRGTEKLFWGWGNIAKKVQAHQQYRPLYFEARYYQTLCTYRQALTKEGDEQKKLLDSAHRTVLLLYRFTKDLGGDERRRLFDNLMKDIQKKQGKNPNGLQELDPPAGAQAAAPNAK